MMLRAVTAGMLAMTLGCAPVPPADGSIQEATAGEGETMCDASKAESLIGRTATAELGAEALRLTGARGLRWIQPGQAVTMDYRPDRLNIELDGQNRVVKIRCG